MVSGVCSRRHAFVTGLIMPCTVFKTENGWGIACSRGAKRATKCSVCGRLGADKLCDWKMEGGTCDRPLCSRCAVHVSGEDLDFCPSHDWKGAA